MFQLTDLVNSTGVDGIQSTGSIIIPLGASTGQTRMRVIKRFSTVPGPCNTAGYGQAEDYTLEINPAPSCLPASSYLIKIRLLSCFATNQCKTLGSILTYSPGSNSTFLLFSSS